jgi:hypothetical protein
MVINRWNSIRRYRQIIAVFTKHGFGLLMDQLGIFHYLKIKKRILDTDAKSDSSRLSTGARLRLSLEELGPAFVKLGQILSTRPDILPPDIVEELKKLQDSVPPFSFSEVRAVIEDEFEDKLENIYKEFEEKPVAAASISQVHRARLNSGKPVAVKVQRPGIERTINLDINILKDLAGFIDHHTQYGKLYDCSGMVLEFENIIKNELDFTKEAENAEAFKQNFTRDKGIIVPNVKWIYTTKRILTMEYIEGIRVDNYFVTGNGTGEIYSELPLQTLRTEIKGSSSLDLIQVSQADIKITGSGSVSIENLCGNLSGTISGSGNITILDGNAEEVDVSVSGSGDLVAGITAKIARLSLSGSGTIIVAHVLDESIEQKTGSGILKIIKKGCI